MQAKDIVEGIREGNKVALAKAITRIENDTPESREILSALYPDTGHAYEIGLTGPPGAGKSTLVDRLSGVLLDEDNRVGVIAVDPTSPFSGGALLGDRVRMSRLSGRENAFVRSMATRGSLGGLSSAAKDASLAMDAFGMDYILIETVGVGQIELDVADACDTTVVVLVPESGDSVQAMKAGLLEIADVVVINKADRAGAQELMAELRFMFDVRPKTEGYEPPILECQAVFDRGIDELLLAIRDHRQHLETTGSLGTRRKRHLRSRIREMVETALRRRVEEEILPPERLNRLVDRAYNRETDVFQVVYQIVSEVEQTWKGKR
jgi:LAO/AO transport system kinase